jgi:hypothetical protein
VADKASTPKEPAKPEEPKKKAKKLTIVDANEPAATPAPADKKGDTPPLADEEELAAIAEAFADVPETPPKKKSSKKIAVTHADEAAADAPAEDAPVSLPSQEDQSTEASTKEEEPAEAASLEEVETVAEETAEAEADAAAPEEKTPEESGAETPPGEDQLAAAAETPLENVEVPAEEAVPEKRPLSQLTNNIPRPQPPAEDLTEGIEPDKEFADDQIAHAVDEIVAGETDELLAQEDAAAAAAQQPAKKTRSLKALIGGWWRNPAARWGTLAGVFLLLVLVLLLPASRYGLLNAMGVRATSSMTVISNESQQPLKNAKVTLAGQTASTDDEGKVTFTKLRLGNARLEITKRGFASVQQSRVLGWGSNPLGSIGMTVTGTRFIFTAKDFLSGKAVSGAEAISGDYNALADDKGKIILAVDQAEDKDLTVTIKADGYREETVIVKRTDTGEKAIEMAADHPRVFVSKRSGKLDIYKVDADGKNESVLLAATGKERNDLALLQQPNGDFTAIVSTRLGSRNKSGYLLSNLFVLNNKTGELVTLNQSERIQLVDWAGDRVVFIAVTEGASAANPNRSKLFSYQIGQPGARQIASANYFNDATVFKGALYYAPSSYAVPASSVKFYKVSPDGSGLSTLLNSEVWNIFRSDYDTLQLSVQQDWYELRTSGTPSKLANAPANPKSRVYRDAPDGKRAAWIDNRDGKGVLIVYEIGSKHEQTVASQSGLQQPVYWLNGTTLAYRISDGRETADYVRSTDGGEAKKLRDVTATDSTNYFN